MTIAEARSRIPTQRNDFWHYAPLDELSERVARSVAPSGGVPTLVSPSLIDAMTCGPGPRLVFVNGVPVAIVGQAFPYTPIANPRHFVPDWTFGIQEDELQKVVDEARAKARNVVAAIRVEL